MIAAAAAVYHYVWLRDASSWNPESAEREREREPMMRSGHRIREERETESRERGDGKDEMYS